MRALRCAHAPAHRRRPSQVRGQLDQAEDWYRKALAINEELGNRPGMASTYHQLGITAQARGQLDDDRRVVARVHVEHANRTDGTSREVPPRRSPESEDVQGISPK